MYFIMSSILILLFLWSIMPGLASSAATFDQRQTGNLNVQVDLKDLQIIALMKGGKEEYVDYDYAYDYNEMTIKPQNGTTTPKPLNVSSNASSIENENATVTISTTETPPSAMAVNNSHSFETEQVPFYTTVIDSTTTMKNSDADVVTITANSANNTATASSSSCRKGFFMNKKGNCELKLQGNGTGNALLKLVKLSQKLKLRRENRRNYNETDMIAD